MQSLVLPVVLHGVGESFGYHVAQLRWLKNSDAGAVGEYFLHEVGGDAHAVVEDGVEVVEHFALGVVQG